MCDARFDVRSVLHRLRQILENKTDALDRNAGRDRVIEFGAIGLEAMRQRIHAGAGGDEGRHADRQLRVGDHHLRHHLRMKDDLLGVRRLVGDHAGAADLRAGAGRRRHRDDRRDAPGVGARPPVADVLEIPDRALLPGHEGDELAGIEPAAAAEGDDAVMAAGLEDVHARSEVRLDRVWTSRRRRCRASVRPSA